MTGTGPRTSGTVALPLQWPLVGRHAELEGFAASLADSRALTASSCTGPLASARPASPISASQWPTRQGRMIARATATEGLGHIPLGALAHLLPAGIGAERTDLVAVVAEIRPSWSIRRSTGRLSCSSTTCTCSTRRRPLCSVSSSMPTWCSWSGRSDPTRTLPGGLESLWRRARVQRIDLANLDRPALDALLHLVLRGPVEATTAATIWNASDGNVLFARELVLASVDSGILAEQHGVWRLTGALVGSTRLHELIASRLAGLGTGARAAMDVIAVWGTIGLSSLEAIVDGASLDELDRRGLLRVRSDRRRQEVSLAQPLYGDLVRSRMPELTRRRLLLDMVARIDAHGARRREDPIVVATATLEATGSADRGLLLRAARLARFGHDFVQVERLARAALAEGGGAEAGMLLGEALHEVGTHAECEAVLAAAEQAGGPDDLLAQIVELPRPQPDVGLAPLRGCPRGQPGDGRAADRPRRRRRAEDQRGDAADLLRAAARGARDPRSPRPSRDTARPGVARAGRAAGAGGHRTRGDRGRPAPGERSPSTAPSPGTSPSRRPACTSSPAHTG